MRAGNLSDLEVQHLREEIEEMGRSEESELLFRFEILLIYLLKWRFRSAHRVWSWQLPIAE